MEGGASTARSGRAPDEGSISGVAGMRFHHVGVAVRSLETALGYYVNLFGFEPVGEPVEVTPERVRVCFVRAAPGVLIELVEGLDEASPVEAVLERFGGGTYHICYQVPDLESAVKTLRDNGCRPFRRFDVETSGPRRFAFLLTPDRQLFELCESVADPGASP